MAATSRACRLPKSGDYAFVQHMIKSMAPKTGRMAVVLPHGALFRMGKEGEIRQKLLAMDLLEAVIGLGPTLFYGTGLAACILVFRQKKAKDRRNKVLIVDASKEFKTGRAQNELLPEHVERIHGWVRDYTDVEGIARVVTLEEIAANDHNLKYPALRRAEGPNGSAYRAGSNAAVKQKRRGRICRRGSASCATEGKRSLTDMTRITQQQLESYLGEPPCFCEGRLTRATTSSSSFRCCSSSGCRDVFDEETLTALRGSGGDQALCAVPRESPLSGASRRALARRSARSIARSGTPLQQAMRAIEVENQDKLMGIFGDAQWTNKDRPADAMLRDLIEHFSTLELYRRQPARGRARPRLRAFDRLENRRRL